MNNILTEIERNYPVERVLSDGQQVWSHLRVRYYYAYQQIEVSQHGESQPSYWSPPQTLPRMKGLMRELKVRLELTLRMLRLLGLARRLLRMLQRIHKLLQRLVAVQSLKKARRLAQSLRGRQIFYGFKNWFGTYEYVVLSNSGERRSIYGKRFHKLADPVTDRLDRGKVLYIEAGAPRLYPIETVHSKRIVSRGLLTAVALVMLDLMPAKCALQGQAILDSIGQDYGLKFDYMRWIRLFDAQKRVFALVFRMIKPKVIFVTDYISYAPAIRAAKELGMTVMEFQHGSIGKEHPSYNLDVEIDRSCFPDYLLVFGRREVESFRKSHLIEATNVIPIGSFYIEYVRNNHRLDVSLVKKLEGYRRTVAVTLQWTYEKRTIEFVIRAAELDPRVFYVLIPRQPLGYVQGKDTVRLSYEGLLPGNVAFATDKSSYELIMYVDFHATVYSTCALEAPSLGAQNILINIDNLSRKYFADLLYDDRLTCYAGTPEEFVQTVNTFQRLDRDTVIVLNQDIIAPDYERNIEELITEHLLD